MIFAVTVIYGIYFHFLSGPDSEAFVKIERDLGSPTNSLDSPGDRPAELQSKENSDEIATLEWKRDPFRYDGGFDDRTVKNNSVNVQSSSKP